MSGRERWLRQLSVMLALAIVEDGFDVVNVGIEYERSVVARVVVGALPRRAVVAIARGERDFVEPGHRLDVGHAESQVDVLRRLVARDERERAVAVAELDPVRRDVSQLDAYDRRDGLVEAFRSGDVARAQPEMVDLTRADAVVVHGFHELPAGSRMKPP